MYKINKLYHSVYEILYTSSVCQKFSNAYLQSILHGFSGCRILIVIKFFIYSKNVVSNRKKTYSMKIFVLNFREFFVEIFRANCRLPILKLNIFSFFSSSLYISLFLYLYVAVLRTVCLFNMGNVS